MKTIIAGSRHFTDYDLLCSEVDKFQKDYGIITEIVSGGATGADQLGTRYAAENGIPVTEFPADWTKYGRAAGPIRNQEMADYADALIAFPVIDSKGTWDMVRKARAAGLVVRIIE